MKSLIIAVGGNGVHSVLGYLHLCRLLNEDFPKPFRVKGAEGSDKYGNLLIIDADFKTNKEKALSEVFKRIYTDAKGNSYDTELYWMDPNPSWITKGTTFQELFKNEPFLSFLYEESHKEQNIFHGFVGKPPVGSATFALKVEEDLKTRKIEGEISSVEENFISALEGNAGYERIIFVGSFVGGTGAGVIPATARMIRDSLKRKDIRIEIAYISHGKWFNIDDLYKNEVLERNVIGGMAFLTQEKDLFDKIILLDLPEPIIRKNDGDEGQEEKRDLMYLIAGLLIRGLMKFEGSIQDARKFYTLAFSLSQDQSLYSAFAINDHKREIDDLNSFLFERKDKSLEEKIKKAYKVYYFLCYFIEFMGTTIFDLRENPLKDSTQDILMAQKEKVKEVLISTRNRLEESLRWFEDLVFPQIWEKHKKLNGIYSIRKFHEETKGDTHEMGEYLQKLDLNVKKFLEKLVVEKSENFPQEFENKIWELMEKEV